MAGIERRRGSVIASDSLHDMADRPGQRITSQSVAGLESMRG